MYSQVRKYFRFRYRVIFVAFLLISPTTSSVQKQDSTSSLAGFILQCATIVSAWIKDPNGFLKIPDKATIEQVSLCIQRIPEIIEMIKHTWAKGPLLNAALAVVSGYVLYESTQLYERAKDLEENHEKYDHDFKLLKDEYSEIQIYIRNVIERDWKNGNTAKMVTNLEKVMKTLTSFFNRLSELADHTRKDIKQIRREKTRCYASFLFVIGVCPYVAATAENRVVIIFTCSVGVFVFPWSLHSFFCLNETHEKSELLKKAIMTTQREINKVRASLGVVMMRVD